MVVQILTTARERATWPTARGAVGVLVGPDDGWLARPCDPTHALSNHAHLDVIMFREFFFAPHRPDAILAWFGLVVVLANSVFSAYVSYACLLYTSDAADE